MKKTSKSKIKYFTPIYDMSSQEYHSTSGVYSSSQLKDLLEDEEIFINKYIKKTVKREEISAFDVGTYFHTAILEPDKISDDCAVYDRKIRRGSHWEKFRRKHDGKAILTRDQRDKALGLVSAVQNSPIAMGLISKGTPEVSLFVKLKVWLGSIYCYEKKKVLTLDGWIDDNTMPEISDGVDINIKVRADSINFDEGYILDLKSTTGNSKSESTIKNKISYYQYDLSAALYLDMFSLYQEVGKFFWTFASKDVLNTKTWMASNTNIKVGRAKYIKALLKLAECIENEWQVVDSLSELEPMSYELEHLKQKMTDLI